MRNFFKVLLQLNRKTTAVSFQTTQRVSIDKTTRKCVWFFFVYDDHILSFYQGGTIHVLVRITKITLELL